MIVDIDYIVLIFWTDYKPESWVACAGRIFIECLIAHVHESKINDTLPIIPIIK